MALRFLTDDIGRIKVRGLGVGVRVRVRVRVRDAAQCSIAPAHHSFGDKLCHTLNLNPNPNPKPNPTLTLTPSLLGLMFDMDLLFTTTTINTPGSPPRHKWVRVRVWVRVR